MAISKQSYNELKEYWDYQRKVEYNRELVHHMAEKFKVAFEGLGYKTIYWSMSDYSVSYETINEHTKGKIKDHHWSFKGNRDFFEEIIKPQLNDIK